MCALRWDERPSPDHTSRMQIPVVRTPKSSKLYVWLLGPFRGLWTHYVRKKTQPCLTQDCPHCGTVPAHWKGYAPALEWRLNPETGKNFWRTVVVEITEGVEELFDRQDLVGQVIMLNRRGTKPNGPLYYEVCAAHLQPKEKPPVAAFDPEPIVERLFDVPGRHLRPVAGYPRVHTEEPNVSEGAVQTPVLNGDRASEATA